MISDRAASGLPFLLRPGPTDCVVLDRLLTADLFSRPVQLDGLPIEAPLAPLYADLRPRLPTGAMFIVDPQLYRLQGESIHQPAPKKLPYCPTEDHFTPADFETDSAVVDFVSQVLKPQQELGVSSFVAPAFYLESLESPWRDINSRLLRETRKQAGVNVFATLCGSYSGLCGSTGADDVVGFISKFSVEGVLVLISPLRSIDDGPTKLAKYVRLLERLAQSFGSVIACRQPAFGLGCMALGIAGFDSGLAAGEQFDYASLMRRQGKPVDHASLASKAGFVRRRTVYLSQLLTRVPFEVAQSILSTSGVAGSFVCREPCCHHNLRGALIQSREHFVYSRVNEVAQMRSKPQAWRKDYICQQLVASRQMAAKVVNAFQDSRFPTFEHLDVWSRVFTNVGAESVVN